MPLNLFSESVYWVYSVIVVGVFIKLIRLVYSLDDHQENEYEGDQQNKQYLQGHQDEQSLQEIQDLQNEHGHQGNGNHDSHDEGNVEVGVAVACAEPEGTQELVFSVHPLDDHQKNECEGDQQNKQDLQGHQDEQSLQEIQDLQTEHGHQDNDSHDEDNVGMGVAIACTRPEGTQEMVFSVPKLVGVTMQVHNLSVEIPEGDLTNCDDDSESEDESNVMMEEELLEEKFLLAELVSTDEKIPDDDTPKQKISSNTPVEDNLSSPVSTRSPVEGNRRLPQKIGAIVDAEEVTILPNIVTSRPTYAPVMNHALSNPKVSQRDQEDPLLDPKNRARVKEMHVKNRSIQDEGTKCVQCMDDVLPTGKPNLVIANI